MSDTKPDQIEATERNKDTPPVHPSHDEVRRTMHSIAQLLDELFKGYPHHAILVTAAPEEIDSDPFEDPMRVETLMKGPEEMLILMLNRQLHDMMEGGAAESTEIFPPADEVADVNGTAH